MLKRKKVFIILLIIIFIFGIILILNNTKKVAKTEHNGRIGVIYNSNATQVENNIEQQMTLSTEKTTGAMENNSKVLQKAIDDVSNAGGGTVRLPAGTYYFAPIGLHEGSEYYAIRCKNNVKIIGAGTDESNVNSYTILKPYSNNLEEAFTMFDYTNSEPGVYLENADFENFVINGEESTKSGPYSTQGKGFAFQYFKDCDWNNVVVKNTDSTGFGMDFPINCTVNNCIAIRCGKKASDTDVGASGFGIGTGYSEDESMKISNCTAIGNRKFGFFFEHQTRFGSDTFQARKAKGFVIQNCVAKGNMYNFGGERAYDIIYSNCISENMTNSDPEPLRNQNETAFYFGTNSRRTYLINCESKQKYNNLTDTGAFYYEPVLWAANNSIIDIGESKAEYEALEECGKAEAIVMLWRFAGRPGNVLIGEEQVNTGYDDVSTNEWYSDAVAWGYEQGILSGGESYSPTIGCNRGDFITMLWRYAGEPKANKISNYTDVKEGDFFYDAVNWAVSEGIIEKQGTEFMPATPYTNGEILTLLYRYDTLNPKRLVIYDYWENNGNDVEKVYEVKEKGEKVDLNIEAKKEGYEFIGWSTNENATSKINSLNMNSDNIYLYALYKKNINIIYNANGGENVPDVQTETLYNKQENVNLKLSDMIPIKNGYTFKGWSDEEGSNVVKFLPGENYIFADSCILYAIWEEKTETEESALMVKPNGGTWNNNTEDTKITGNLGDTIEIQNPIPKKGAVITFDANGGHVEKQTDTCQIEFDKWTLEGEGKLEGTKYTFGEGQGVITANYINKGTEIPEASKEGFKLRGWTDEEGSNEVKFLPGENYVFDEDSTLYAIWGDENTYTVIYNYSYNGGDSVDKEQDEKQVGENVDLSVTANKLGYEFVGWSENPDAKEKLETLVMEDKDITLYAIFKKDINITFIDYKDLEEQQTEKNITIYNNEKAEVIAPKINKYLDWNSKYWSIEKTADAEKTVGEKEKITDIVESTTYYARYSKEIEITFNLNGGNGTLPETIKGNIEVNSSNISFIKEFEIVVPSAEISREGYSFSGWMSSKDGSGIDYKVGDTILFNSSTTFYAKWIKQGEEIEDTVLPTLDIEYEPKNEWTNQDIELLITAYDKETGIDNVAINGETILNDNGNTTYIIKENGNYEIIATDNAKNSYKKSITISNIDKNLPVIDKIEIDENLINIDLNDEESGIRDVEISYDNKTWISLINNSENKDFILKDYIFKKGKSQITIELLKLDTEKIFFRAIDEAGNIGESKILSLKDNEKPSEENKNNTNNLISGNNNYYQSGKDDGRTDKVLPNAGVKSIFILLIIITIVVAMILRRKYNSLKDIK